MNALYLKFDLPHTDGVEFNKDALRHALSTIIDAVLKRPGQGHWGANSVKGNQLQVKCCVHNPAPARAQIALALS